MSSQRPRKLVRSYRLVFRRRWRIFKVQNWRIPLPNGLELRAVGYWAASLAAIALIARVPLLGLPVAALPPSIRLLAAPVAVAWALSRWGLDGRSAHRALLGLIGHILGPRHLAGLRRCPAEDAELAPLHTLTVAPDLSAPEYPSGWLRGPARILLRYPFEGRTESGFLPSPRRRNRNPAAARSWRVRGAADGPPLHRGHVVQVPEGGRVRFE